MQSNAVISVSKNINNKRYLWSVETVLQHLLHFYLWVKMNIMIKLFLIYIFSVVLCDDYPDPRIVIVGATGILLRVQWILSNFQKWIYATGVGKSSLGDSLLGCDPRSGGCTFNVCGGTNSCTNQTTIGSGPWLGSGQQYTVKKS